MEDLVPVTRQVIGGEEVFVVNARDLHRFLEVGKDFSTWIKDRIRKFGFVDGQDYVCIESLSSPILGSAKARPQRIVEYFLTLDMAKELAMVDWVRSVVQHRNGRLAQGLRDVTRAVRRPQSVRAAALEWANRQQERWHAAEQARSRAEKYVEWTPILDGEYVDASGWTFRELTDSDSLDTEGREMHHCVAEYADGCSLGKSHIFSVVGPQGERATLEVQGETFLVLQLRGPCNQAVSEDCQKAAQRFAQGLRRRLRRGVIQKGNAGDLLTAPKPPAPGRPEAVLRSPLHPRHPPAR